MKIHDEARQSSLCFFCVRVPYFTKIVYFKRNRQIYLNKNRYTVFRMYLRSLGGIEAPARYTNKINSEE